MKKIRVHPLLKSKNPRPSASKTGIAALTTILALVVLLIAITAGISFLSYTENSSSANQNNSAQALEYAETGARDALQRLARNKTYNCPASGCYTIDFSADGTGCSASSACASVSVSAADGSAATPKNITSTGQVGSDIRTIQVQVLLDSSMNGQIATTTWMEATQ
jgi:Tfp pilus assembly protein PilX